MTLFFFDLILFATCSVSREHGAAMKRTQQQILQLLDLHTFLACFLTGEMTNVFLLSVGLCLCGSAAVRGGAGWQGWLCSPCRPALTKQMPDRSGVPEHAVLCPARPPAKGSRSPAGSFAQVSWGAVGSEGSLGAMGTRASPRGDMALAQDGQWDP